MTTTPKARMLEAQKLYEQIKEDNAALRAFEDVLSAAFERMGRMQTYYQDSWMEDMDTLDKAGENIEVMGQDPIYNEMEDQYAAVKRIILKCAEYINR